MRQQIRAAVAAALLFCVLNAAVELGAVASNDLSLGTQFVEDASPATFDKFLDRLMRAESNGRDEAANPRSTALGAFQFIKSSNPAIEITAMEMQGNDLVVRFFNPSVKPAITKLTTGFTATEMLTVELDGRVKKAVKPAAGNPAVEIRLPAFGIETIRFTGVKNK